MNANPRTYGYRVEEYGYIFIILSNSFKCIISYITFMIFGLVGYKKRQFLIKIGITTSLL